MTHQRTGIATVRGLVLASLVASVLAVSAVARAQNPNQFGGQARADATSRMIVLGVQQGISSLPPTSGQSFTYELDPTLATYVSSERLGPTALRSPQTIGANRFSFRMATSYFELANTKAPIPYQVNDSSGAPIGVARIGLRANAHVGIVNLGGNYGITDRVEMTVNVPVVVVNAQATQIFSALTSERTLPADEAQLGGVGVDNGAVEQAVDILDAELASGQQLFLRKDSLNALGFDFNQGTHAGVGRISIGGKVILYADSMAQVAFAPDLFWPSPSQDEFAGSNTAAFLPRFIGAVKLGDPFRVHLDVGYDYDFERNELRRFVWNTGASFAIRSATFDLGVGGSKFNEGIEWSPSSAPYTDLAGTSGTIQALGDTRLGSNFIDALVGAKVRIADKTVLSGSVTVPLNNEGFRAAAVGTVAVEQYF